MSNQESSIYQSINEHITLRDTATKKGNHNAARAAQEVINACIEQLKHIPKVTL